MFVFSVFKFSFIQPFLFFLQFLFSRKIIFNTLIFLSWLPQVFHCLLVRFLLRTFSFWLYLRQILSKLGTIFWHTPYWISFSNVFYSFFFFIVSIENSLVETRFSFNKPIPKQSPLTTDKFVYWLLLVFVFKMKKRIPYFLSTFFPLI